MKEKIHINGVEYINIHSQTSFLRDNFSLYQHSENGVYSIAIVEHKQDGDYLVGCPYAYDAADKYLLTEEEKQNKLLPSIEDNFTKNWIKKLSRIKID